MRIKTLGLLAAAVGGVLLSASWAQAESIELTAGDPTISGSGPYTYTYHLTLTAGDTISPSAPDSASSVATTTGSVVIFGDIGGYLGALTNNSNWVVEAPLADPTTFTTGPGANQSYIVGSGVGGGVDVAFKYVGSSYTAPSGPNTNIVDVTIISSIGPGSDGQVDYKARYVTGSTSEENSATPIGPTAVPVPAAAWTGLSMLAACAGLGLIRRRRLV